MPPTEKRAVDRMGRLHAQTEYRAAIGMARQLSHIAYPEETRIIREKRLRKWRGGSAMRGQG